MAPTGMTRARSMGPVAAAVRRSGGSVARIFRQAELPLTLLECPDMLIPLHDQLKLVELAAQETGDDALAARLSLEGGVEHLGEFGRYVCGATRLEAAIRRCNEHMGTALQSATVLRLYRFGKTARWTYSVTDNAVVGRQKNEVLALGYMLDLLRRYFGVPPGAVHAELPGYGWMAGRTALKCLFECEISPGSVAALEFPAKWLDASNRSSHAASSTSRMQASPLPPAEALIESAEHIIALGLLERRPEQEWLCRRLRVSRRSLQRALASSQTSFRALVSRALMSRATELLASSDVAVTTIALELGYSDPAHFTRAFIRHFREPPQAWRHRHRHAHAPVS